MKKNLFKKTMLIMGATGLVLTTMTGCNKKEVDTTEEVTTEATTEEANVIRIEEESFGVAMTLEIGEDGKLNIESDKAVTFESLNEDIVTIDKDGTVTAIGSGKVKVVVTDGEIRKSTFIVVKAEPYVASTEETSEDTEETTEVAENTNTGSNTGSTASNSGSNTGSTGSGSNSGNSSNTGSGNNSGNTNTNPSTPSEPATESTPNTPSEPATEASTETEKTYYYRDWDYICNSVNAKLQANFPNATIQQLDSNYQTTTEFDGYDKPLPYSDDVLAQQIYETIVKGLAGQGAYPGCDKPVTTGLFVQSITNTPGYNQPNRREVVLIYYK
ncbi:MAG: Ig-like domain-containing protein [Lachnospiraceae bacterium]|nr:Ig-like domain-containing protein [Lachnospiraceae bacterium]